MWKRERRGYIVLCWREQGSRDIKTKPEHVWVWERVNGPKPEGAVIHHRNGDKQDNRIENLELVSRGEHPYRHTDNVREVDGRWERHCPLCDMWKPLDGFYKRGESGRQRYCKPCAREYRRQWAQENREHFREWMRNWRASRS